MRVPTKLLGILAVIIIMATATGCDSGNGSNHQTMTENDFVDNPSLREDPDNQIIVDFLESPGSDTPQEDTGPVGMDDIPLTYPFTETVTFCWTDDNTADMDYMVLLDSQGEQVLRVDVNGDCVTDTIEPGDYVMELHHDNSTDPHTIFMGPDTNQNQQAMKTDGLFNGYKVVATKILKDICNTITHDARAQTTMCNNRVKYVLKSNFCRDCDLKDANFRGARMPRVDLRNSDMRNDNLRGTNMSQSSLRLVNFGGADLRGTNFSAATLSGAHIPKRVADYFPTDCPDFSAALWCNGSCTCGISSLCKCDGCGSVAKACNHPNTSCTFNGTIDLPVPDIGCVGPPVPYLGHLAHHCR